MNPLRKRKCKQCKRWYEPRTTMQQVCSPDCAIARAKEVSAKLDKKRAAESKRADREAKKAANARIRAKKQALKSRSDLMREAQQAVNEFVRERDHNQRCISCGADNAVKMNAGHYRSVGSAPELRFDTRNIYKQCEKCNSYLSGNLIEYRRRLLLKIGAEKLERIEGYHAPKKYSRNDLIRIKQIFKRKTKRLRNARENSANRDQSCLSSI